jgi:hypothetical protein
VLYIYVIQKRAASPEIYSDYFTAATRCQTQISAIAEKGSLSERFCLVLEELRVEALRQVKKMHPTLTSLSAMDEQSKDSLHAMPMPVDDSPSTGTNYGDVLGGDAIDFNGMPSSAFVDSSGWGQFASMISSGLGNFDTFLTEDSFRI